MAYGRGGVFRSRFIAPQSQRATEILSKPVVTQAALVFDAAAGNFTTTALDNEIITIGPLAVDNAAGQERLVFVGGLSLSAGATGGDFDACTIDGQVATRVGTVVKSFPVSGPRSTFVTAYRAPGTTNTSISVALTVNSIVPDSTVTNASAACFKLSNAGTNSASTSGTSSDPTLDLSTATAKGTAMAGLYGYSATAFAASSTTPVFRSMDSTSYSNRTDTTITKPAGVVDGDILLATVFQGNFGLIADVVTPPAGWTQIGTTVTSINDGNFFGNFYAFWHRASSDGADYTFSHAFHSAQGAITAYSGCVASGDPVDAFSQNTANTTSTLTATGITTSSNNARLVLLAQNWDATGTLTPPTGMTERFDSLTYFADEDFATAGATGDRTQTLASSNPWSAFLVALKPVAGGGGGVATAWTGLTERVDSATSPVTFSVASANILVTSSPLAVSADITPNLTSSTDSVASLSMSFNPVPARTLAALSGVYAMTGATTSPIVGRKVAAASGTYAMTGTAATLHNVQHIAAAAGSYAMTGINANINPSAGATASIVFDATDTDVTALSSGTYTFPLTVAASPGERLVVVGGIAGTDGDFSAVTIGGNAATRVGFVSRGVADSSGYTPFLTAYRAPGTAATSINVVATIGGSLKTWTAAYCAGFRMNGAGFVYASTNANSNDPTLSTDVVNKGAVVAALLGYADAVTPPTVAWTGLTERFDAVRALSSDVFSGASIDISSAAVPVFRSVSNGPYNTKTGQTAILKPTGTVDGDILVATLFAGSAVAADVQITPPAGWTQIGTETSVAAGGFFGKLYVYWKRAASEPSGWDWVHSGAGPSINTEGVVAAYSGCITSDNPIDVFSTNSASGGSLATATGVTTTVASTKLIYAAHNWDGTATLSPPTGMTERYDSVAYLADADFAGPGATGDFTQALATSNPWSAVLLALKPATSPRAITADITPNLTDVGTDSVASLCLSFLPGGTAGSALIAAPGTYAMTGLAALTQRGFKTVASAGSYAMTGTPATFRVLGRLIATAGSYAMTGSSVGVVKGGAAKAILALPGSYAMTGTAATMHRGVKARVTTVGSYNVTGTSPVSTGMGLIAVAGSYAMTGTAASLVKRAGSGISISVGSTALTASSGTAVVHTTVGVLVSGVGNVATVSVGTPSVAVSGGIVVFASGTSAAAFVGNVSVSTSGGIEVNVTGLEMTASVGDQIVVIPARVTVTGNPMTASAGTVTVNVLGSANILVLGNRLDASVGTVSFRTNANVSVTGNPMTVSVGNVDAFAVAAANVTGNEMTASVGNVTVTAKQNTVVNVDGFALQSYVGLLDFAGGGTITHPSLKNREGRMLQPSNFMGG